jgi:membrane-associated phospholipid phosphatase
LIPFFSYFNKKSLPMRVSRVAACFLVICALAVPAWAQDPLPAENPGGSAALITPETDQATPAPQLVRPTEILPATAVETSNIFKLSAGDFKNFFRADTAKVMGYVSLVAIATAPWDREGIDNGFNIPTALFESGNLLGQFAFQATAGFATYGIAKAVRNPKAAHVGRDIVRAQLLSQAMVQTLKYTVRRERPDGSNNKSFPSGHSASAFATATVLQRHYGWKVGVPAYTLGGYIALARMAWNRHHATDVVMGAGFGIASARTVTMSLAKSKFSVGVQPQTGGASLNFTKIYQ